MTTPRPDSRSDEPQTEEAGAARVSEHDSSPIHTKVSRGVGWNMLAGVVIEAATLTQFLILPMFLSPDDYGIYGLAAGIAFVGFMLRDFSLGMKFIQDREQERQHAFDTAFTLEMLLGAAGFVFVALAAPVAGLAYGNPEVFWIVLAMAPFAFAGALALPSFVLIRDLRFAVSAVRTIIQQVVTLAATLLAAWAGLGTWAIVIGMPVNMVMLAVTLWPIVHIRPHFVWDREAFRKYMKFGWPLWAGSLCLAAFYLIALNAVMALFGLAIAGFFQRVWRLIEFSYRLNMRSQAALYPAVCRVGTERERLRRVFTVVNRSMMLVSAPVGIVLMLFSPDLVTIWPGDWQGVAPMFQAVGTFFIFGTLAFDYDVYYRAEGNTMPLFVIQGWLLAFLPGFLALVWQFGETGLYAAIVLVGIYIYLIRSHFARKLLGPVSALRASWKEICAAIVAGGIGYAVSVVLGGGLVPGIAGIAVMGVIYLGTMVVVEWPLVGFLLTAVRGGQTGGLAALVDGDRESRRRARPALR